METVIAFEDFPYYLAPTDKNKVFTPIKSITYNEDYDCSNNNEYIECRDTSLIEFGDELEIGKDIREIPNRNLSLIVRVDEKDMPNLRVIQEAIKFAELSWHDYVASERFGDNMCRYLYSEGKTRIFEFRPRLFRRIQEDDF